MSWLIMQFQFLNRENSTTLKYIDRENFGSDYSVGHEWHLRTCRCRTGSFEEVLSPANGAAFNARHLPGSLVVEKTTTTIFCPANWRGYPPVDWQLTLHYVPRGQAPEPKSPGIVVRIGTLRTAGHLRRHDMIT
jgi:hypothetical protein